MQVALGAAKDRVIAQNTPTGLLQENRLSITPVQQGMDFVGSGTKAFDGSAAASSLQALAATGTTWISINVLQYQASTDTTSIFPTIKTVSNASLSTIIQKAHTLHLNVTLKPMVDTESGAWRGLIGASFTHSEWIAWFASYHAFILHYAKLAQKLGVQQLVVGTELGEASKHAREWVSLVHDIRKVFKGTLTYAANWGSEVEGITWWGSLNYIGVDAYYPLNSSEADYGWSNYLSQLAALSARFGNKPILFTEVGYMSTAGSPNSPGDSSLTGNLSLETQADAYQAVLEAVSKENWFAGMYWWAWGPQVGNGPTDPGYSPQNKPAERIISEWYGGAGDESDRGDLFADNA